MYLVFFLKWSILYIVYQFSLILNVCRLKKRPKHILGFPHLSKSNLIRYLTNIVGLSFMANTISSVKLSQLSGFVAQLSDNHIYTIL